ncbi:TonB-dependent receptor [Sphingobacterium thalpophilum]|uniref:TonB-dependent receptor n=1 Tax=Sphingobacterium thalpophilum TaxID=259 RepID=UPI003C73497B
MKLTFLLTLVACLQVKAAVYSQQVSLTLKRAPLEKVIKEIRKQTGYAFFYDAAYLKDAAPVSVNLKNAPIKDALRSIFQHQRFSWEVLDKTIVIKPSAKTNSQTPVQKQETAAIDITGRVVDSSNRPIAGVTVSVKGSTKSTVSDQNGQFTLSAQAGDVLVLRSVGYDTKEVTLDNSATITITLQASTQSLEEVKVVAVGYGTQRQRNVTGSVVRANIDAFKDAPNTNLMQSLQGTVPGLNVGPVTVAGSTPSIQVRGQNTISGGQNVLIIVDGIQYNNDLSSINPDDVESIDLLKDASATAVYGAQAANGVLLITTKKGNYNAKPVISLSSSYATQSPSVDNRPMNRTEFLDYIKDLYWDKAYLGPDYTTPNPEFDLAKYVHRSHANDSRTELVGTDFDWWKAGTKTGFINDNQLSITGGGEKVSYLISGGYTNQAGFIVNDLFKRTSARSNVEARPFDWLTVGLQASGSFVNKDGAEPSIYGLFIMSPLNSPYNPDGSYAVNPVPDTFDLNPFFTYDVDDYERHNYLTANTYANIKFPFIKGLSYRINFGNNYRTDKHYYASQYAQNQKGEAYKDDEQLYDYTLDNILTYDRTFGDHSLTATALYGAVERKYDRTRARGIDFSNITLGYNNIGLAAQPFIESDAYREALNYQMARINYAYKSRYLLTATLRRDGFSGFAKNNKFATFPSASLGWIFTDEPFAERISWLNYGKLRAGYGLSGTQTPRYTSLDRVNIVPGYVFGDGGSTNFGQSITVLPNPNLKWEKTREFNFALDFGLFNNRISGSLEVYNRRTKDLLFARVIPQLTGFASIQSNIGAVGNKGFELMVNSTNIQKERFKWNSTFSLSRNVNKVLELLGTGDLPSSSLFIGHPLGTIYGYQVDGIYQLNDQIPDGFYPGSYRVVDTNGDGEYSAADRVILGSDNPAYRFSVLNTFKYDNFTLSVFVNSIQGGKNGYLGNNSQSIQTNELATRINHNSQIDYWTPANPNGEYPLLINAQPIINPSVYKDRSFVRLQDITLAYDFGKMAFAQRLGFQNLGIYVSGKNLVTWTKWKGWDPEISPATGNNLDSGGRPLIKAYSLGIKASF